MKKPIKALIFICSIFCLLLLSIEEVGAAEEGDDNKGKLNLEIDRIGENNSGEESINIETELDKKFPELFEVETKEIIDRLDEEKKADIDELEASILLMNDLKDTTLNDTKDALFKPSYEAPRTSSKDMKETEEKSIGKGFLFSLIGVVSLLCVGIYMLMLRFSG